MSMAFVFGVMSFSNSLIGGTLNPSRKSVGTAFRVIPFMKQKVL